ncbi:MAG: flagellar biosynthesis protein FlhB [Deltaproteobacteria bacterium]|nr:flagellar biosynthesis protein FlhB [Deltaproteobacteria bacterium]MBW2307927.1 flagellar biosynthesis protein FlhB [Deltaproteobacteria bacterium]
MPDPKDQEKTEPASPKRQEEARKEGHVARSREVPSVLVLLAGLTFLSFWGSGLFFVILETTRDLFTGTAEVRINQDMAAPFFRYLITKYVWMLFPLFAFILLAALIGNYIQIGFLFSAKAIAPNFSKISPVSGFKKLFSKQSLAEFLKNLMKIAIVGSVAFYTLKAQLPHVFPMVQMDLAGIVTMIKEVALSLGFRTAWVLAALAALDYAFQRWEYEKKLRMSKQEVKDELKQREGDPLVKARIRSIQREMARRRMMAAVPKADVVITNPVRLAVALEYMKDNMNAPRVTAKGAEMIAEKIKEIARGNGVPIVEDKPLAQALFRNVEIGKEIPSSLFKAVAEILAYVYKLKGKSENSV